MGRLATLTLTALLLAPAAFAKSKNLTDLTPRNYGSFTSQPAAIVEITGFSKDKKVKEYHGRFAAYCAAHTEVPCGVLNIDPADNYALVQDNGVVSAPHTFFYKDGRIVARHRELSNEDLARIAGEVYAPAPDAGTEPSTTPPVQQ